ncbi:hypothetical protein Tco_0146016 [Tanacetum coccineum]
MEILLMAFYLVATRETILQKSNTFLLTKSLAITGALIFQYITICIKLFTLLDHLRADNDNIDWATLVLGSTLEVQYGKQQNKASDANVFWIAQSTKYSGEMKTQASYMYKLHKGFVVTHCRAASTKINLVDDFRVKLSGLDVSDCFVEGTTMILLMKGDDNLVVSSFDLNILPCDLE